MFENICYIAKKTHQFCSSLTKVKGSFWSCHPESGSWQLEDVSAKVDKTSEKYALRFIHCLLPNMSFMPKPNFKSFPVIGINPGEKQCGNEVSPQKLHSKAFKMILGVVCLKKKYHASTF